MTKPALLLEAGGREYLYVHLAGAQQLPPPLSKGCFPCLLWAVGEHPGEDRCALVTSLMDAGCRYFVCGGDSPDLWETEADMAFVEAHLGDDATFEREHVMTTAHVNESVDDVAFFFARCTDFGVHTFVHALVVEVGGSGEMRSQLERALRSAYGD